jgi:hypothetical protein
MGEAGLKRLVLIGISGLLTAACATASTPGPATRPLPAPVAPVLPPPPPPPPVYEPPASSCRAEAHRHLVGRPRSEIPVPTDPAKQRVACTTCPVTMDYREDRLNFFFDAQTGVVKEVRCG